MSLRGLALPLEAGEEVGIDDASIEEVTRDRCLESGEHEAVEVDSKARRCLKRQIKGK